jgi:hypothetical protein
LTAQLKKYPRVSLGFLTSTAGLVKIADSIKTALNKIQKPAEALLKKIAEWYKRMFSSLVQKVMPGGKPQTTPKPAPSSKPTDPDHDKKVKIGLAQIDTEEAKIDAKDNDMKLTKTQAEQVATTVKRNNPIFSKILVHYEVAKNQINYEWFASNGQVTSRRKPYTDVEPTFTEGTKQNPLLIHWPKPASANYSPLYIGDKHKKGAMSQAQLKTLYENQEKDNGVAVTKLLPHGSFTLPTGETLGITNQWHLDVGTVIGPLSPNGIKTPGGGAINEILEKYGFQSTIDKLQGDHIHEIQLGGQDVIGNLWPLNDKINVGAGSKIDKTQFNLIGGKMKLFQLRDYVKSNPSRQIWFKVESVLQGSQ